MKRFIYTLVFLLFAQNVWADAITSYTEDTAPTDTDLVITVDDVSGTPTNKKVEIQNLSKGMSKYSTWGPLDTSATLEIPNGTVANMPVAPATGMVYQVTDGASATDCTVGAGSTKVTCIYTGAVFEAIGAPEISLDTTPQLGGNLDVNGNSIISTSNGNIVINPDGTGTLRFTDLTNCDTIDTDADGDLACGSDAGGAAGQAVILDLTDDDVRSIAENKDDIIDMPIGFERIYVSQSMIEGKGLYTNGLISAGLLVCPMRIDGLRTPAGRYTNHALQPNAEAILA